MRRLEWFTVTFIPSNVLTKDDPLGLRGYVGWKAVIDGVQYGEVKQLLRHQALEFPPNAVKEWTNWALGEIEKVQRMTDAEIAARVDAVRVAEAQARGAADSHA